MPRNRTQPVEMSILVRDRRAVRAIRDLPDYRPHWPEHAPKALFALDQEPGRPW